jgi:hypothetical protein
VTNARRIALIAATSAPSRFLSFGEGSPLTKRMLIGVERIVNSFWIDYSFRKCGFSERVTRCMISLTWSHPAVIYFYAYFGIRAHEYPNETRYKGKAARKKCARVHIVRHTVYFTHCVSSQPSRLSYNSASQPHATRWSDRGRGGERKS